MSRQEAVIQYNKALRDGQRCYKACVHQGLYPYPQALEEILADAMVAGYVELGLVDIPLDQIVGTKSTGRQSAFAADFMPLLSPDSEFAQKWIALCQAHLDDAGIRDPIRCYEYMGRFYVQEGNKRVSVLRSFGAVTIPGHVTRVVPVWSEDRQVRVYYEFMAFYELSRVYRVHFRSPGGFARLQAALGFDPDHVWSDQERRTFLSDFTLFKQVYDKLDLSDLPVTTAEALLVWLQVYPREELHTMTPAALEQSLKAIWPDVEALARGEPISVSTDPVPPPRKGLGRLLDSVLLPGHLNVAFVHEAPPRTSPWLLAHDRGREQLERALGEAVTVTTYCAGEGLSADAVMERAAEEGADVIIATTPSLIYACRKIAARYPAIRVLNCSVAMPYTGVRTYYSRMYEATFVAGAIAGAMSRSGLIGCIASSPSFGVPAGINAFLLGAQMTAPEARVLLKWSCVPGDPLSELSQAGADLVFNRELPAQDPQREPRGLCRLGPDRALEPLACLEWNWGSFYTRLLSSILHGGWDQLNAKDSVGAVNYWWGMASGAVDLWRSPALPSGVRSLADILRAGISSGLIYPFLRPIRDQSGRVRSDGSQWFSPEEILNMDWLCQGVEGTIPPFEELIPQARPFVRLQGIYRHLLPPEKEAVTL